MRWGRALHGHMALLDMTNQYSLGRTSSSTQVKTVDVRIDCVMESDSRPAQFGKHQHLQSPFKAGQASSAIVHIITAVRLNVWTNRQVTLVE